MFFIANSFSVWFFFLQSNNLREPWYMLPASPLILSAIFLLTHKNSHTTPPQNPPFLSLHQNNGANQQYTCSPPQQPSLHLDHQAFSLSLLLQSLISPLQFSQFTLLFFSVFEFAFSCSNRSSIHRACKLRIAFSAGF